MDIGSHHWMDLALFVSNIGMGKEYYMQLR